MMMVGSAPDLKQLLLHLGFRFDFEKAQTSAAWQQELLRAADGEVAGAGEETAQEHRPETEVGGGGKQHLCYI
jgi:hypothetical protein